jgi:hypothetical protein
MIIKKTEKRLLRIRIAHCSFTIKSLSDKIQATKTELFETADEELTAAILSHLKTGFEREFTKTKQRQREKLQRLKQKTEESGLSTTSIDKNRWVINVSRHTLSPAEKSVLEKGLNFAVTPQKLPTDDLIVTTEEACASLPTGQANELRSSHQNHPQNKET